MKQLSHYSSTEFIDIGVNANAYEFGRTILVLSSDHWNDGDVTVSDISMIRCGYDGNNVHVKNIVYDATSIETSLMCSINDKNHITIKGFRIYLLISNRPI